MMFDVKTPQNQDNQSTEGCIDVDPSLGQYFGAKILRNLAFM